MTTTTLLSVCGWLCPAIPVKDKTRGDRGMYARELPGRGGMRVLFSRPYFLPF